MSRSTHSLVTLLCGLLYFGCGNDKIVAADGAIKADPTTLDFGLINLNQSAERSVNLTVVGARDVSISSLDITGANASAYEITTVPQRVQPGVPSLLGVRFYAGSTAGAAEADITLTTDSSANPSLTIHLSATINDPHGGPYTYSSWSDWSGCSSSCGEGEQTRSRNCLNQSAETVSCQLCGSEACSESQSCATDSGCIGATYGSWGSWSACISNMRSRSRACKVGTTPTDCSACGGECTQTEACTVSCNDYSVNVANCASKADCDSVLQSKQSACLAASCQWSGPTVCTVGGSVSSPTCNGGTGKCM